MVRLYETDDVGRSCVHPSSPIPQRPPPTLPNPTPNVLPHQTQPIANLESAMLRTSNNCDRLWQYMIELHAWDRRTVARVSLDALRAARNKDPKLHRFTT